MSEFSTLQGDLEEQFLQCWSITSDLETIVDHLLIKGTVDNDTILMLQGLASLYNIKFDKAFITFESYIYEQHKRVSR